MFRSRTCTGTNHRSLSTMCAVHNVGGLVHSRPAGHDNTACHVHGTSKACKRIVPGHYCDHHKEQGRSHAHDACYVSKVVLQVRIPRQCHLLLQTPACGMSCLLYVHAKQPTRLAVSACTW
jgi:hypothetical protein